MSSGIQILIIVAAIIAAAVYIGFRQRRQAERRLRSHLEGQFGKVPDKVMSAERYARVPGYFLHHRPEDEIDDFTWNDLDMDAVFHRIDSTQSAAGEEYLYALLRSPAGGNVPDTSACSIEQAGQDLSDRAAAHPSAASSTVTSAVAEKARAAVPASPVYGGSNERAVPASPVCDDNAERMVPASPVRYEDIAYYRDQRNSRERIDLQVALRKLGAPGRASMYDFIDPLKKAVPDSNRKHLPAFVLPAVSIVVLFLNVPAGILCLIFSMIVNMASYYHFKAKADPYLSGLSYLLRMMQCGDEVLAAAGKRRKTDNNINDSGSTVRDRSMSGSDSAAEFANAPEQHSGAEGNPEQKMNLRTTACSGRTAPAFDFDRLRDLQKSFARLRRGSGILVSGSSTSGGNPVDFIIDYIRILFHIDLIKFNSMLAGVQQKMPEIDEELTILGRIDTVIALASFEESLPYTCRPEMNTFSSHPQAVKLPLSSAGGKEDISLSFSRQTDIGNKGSEGGDKTHSTPHLMIRDVYHPLLADPVPNSLETDRSILLTGSNASGKSTFLKSVALCALFAQTIGFCPAREYHGTWFRIRSSMALRDNILNGESYFMVEIRSLKRIADLAGDGGRPVLCFIDEVLRGTNTVERIAASSVILKTLADRGVLVFAATHDIELTRLLKDTYRNMHFEEEMGEKDVIFSYKLHDGPAVSRNAIRLLAATGFDADVTAEAQEMAERFGQTGEWAWERTCF